MNPRLTLILVRVRSVTCWSGVLIACAALPACTTTAGGTGDMRTGPTASAMQHPTLEGIPLPSGFTLVADRSVGRESGRFRVARFEFSGTTDPAAAHRFFKEYMPSAGFQLRQTRFDRGEYDMRFDSATEECNIRVKPERFNKTTIVVDIGPLPKGSTEREVKPPTPKP